MFIYVANLIQTICFLLFFWKKRVEGQSTSGFFWYFLSIRFCPYAKVNPF